MKKKLVVSPNNIYTGCVKDHYSIFMLNISQYTYNNLQNNIFHIFNFKLFFNVNYKNKRNTFMILQWNSKYKKVGSG